VLMPSGVALSDRWASVVTAPGDLMRHCVDKQGKQGAVPVVVGLRFERRAEY